MYIRTYVHMCTYIHIHIHAYIHIYIYAYLHFFTCALHTREILAIFEELFGKHYSVRIKSFCDLKEVSALSALKNFVSMPHLDCVITGESDR